jgi:large subunit ribosomal protein L25
MSAQHLRSRHVNAAARPTLAASNRTETGKAVARLRRAGRLPGVVYGHGVPSSNVSIDAHEFELLRKHTGPNTLLDLVVDSGKPTPSLVHGVQVHPVSRKPLHIDLFAVRMTEELTVDVPVVTTGTSVLIEREGGTLSHSIDAVRVRALPDHLPQFIEVSIEGLESFDQVIHARDLPIPADAHLLTDPDEVVVRILPPRIEIEEVQAPSAEGAAAEGAAAGSATETGEAGSAEREARS